MDQEKNLQELCKQVRHHILTSTTNAGSGHPTSSLSAVELVTTLFFGAASNAGDPASNAGDQFFKQDVSKPHDLANDKFILSKGHASPLLYSLYRVAGALTDDDLTKLRDHNSRLEGHPTPLFPYADVATGSLGQGLSIGLGMAIGLRMKYDIRYTIYDIPKVFVLLGDSEFSEGQIYEALQLASHYKTSNLVGILDVNRLGQRGGTMLGWDLNTYAKRIDSFGWKTVIIEDAHNIEEIRTAYESAFGNQASEVRKLTVDNRQLTTDGRPTMIIAKTIKGKGVSFLENKDGMHGKPVPKERLEEALSELGEINHDLVGKIEKPVVSNQSSDLNYQKSEVNELTTDNRQLKTVQYSLHENIATRQAYGDALVELGKQDNSVVVLDAEVSNSTFAETFKKVFPERYFEMFIAEQNMVSVALGLSKVGFEPYVSTFGSFLTRAFDQIRMSQYSYANLNFCGSHVGVAMGPDGSSQMGLEDISMFRSILNSVILYPSDANSAIQQLKLLHEHKGIKYLRTTKAPLPVLYTDEEAKSMKIGGSKILRQSPQDKAVVLCAGITVHETLKAYEHLKNEEISITVIDLYSIKPIDQETIKKFSHLPMIVVEDHYPSGGIGEAVSSIITRNALHVTRYTHLCVRKIPHSGSPEENLRYAEIDASAIVNAVKKLIS